jgi:hypothetical protein
MLRVFISYRRDDTRAITGRIHDHLDKRYDVAMDIYHLAYGTDYTAEIKEQVKRSNVLLSVIGPNWIGATEGKQPRIQDDKDLVRVEVETALESGIPVIPVLVDDASIPASEELPESLRNLDKLNAARIDSDVNFQHDVERLIRAIDAKSKTRRFALASLPWRYAAYALAALLLGRLVFVEYTLRSGSLSKIEEFFSCGARVLYPSISFRQETRAIKNDHVPILLHTDREAVVRLYSSPVADGETMSGLLDKLAKGAMVSYRTMRDDFGILTGWRTSSATLARQQEFYYRAQFTANKQFFVFYEMVHPPKDQSSHPYWNVNEILSRTLLPKGVLSDTPPACDFRQQLAI